MKHIHHLRASWLFVAMVIAVALGESVAWFISKSFDLRFPSVAVGAVCIGLVAGGVSVLYDGRE
jgi:hypothetical protein